MAVVRKLEPLILEFDARHTEVSATYSIVANDAGARFLQIDTYGSSTRKILGKKSQSIRLAPEAIAQLKELLARHF
jgi:hypothetical protein